MHSRPGQRDQVVLADVVIDCQTGEERTGHERGVHLTL